MPLPPLTPVPPVEALALPERLDGRDGTNRGARETAQLSARNDLDAVRAWLSNYADTKTTFENYRKEAERLLLWAVVQRGKPLSSLTHEDLRLYKAFLVDPQPASRWVSLKDDGSPGGKYARGDARWRPFNGPLSPASQRQALVILNGLFTWLVDAGYLRGNPMALLRQRAKRSVPRVTRYLSISLWDEVKGFVAQLPQETVAQRAVAARCRWLTTLFYLQGMRLSEVAGGTMGDFSRRLGPDGQDRWWLEILGKGDKERIVPASPELIAELVRYRKACGLPPLPSRADETPLVVPFRGTPRCLSRSALHDAIKRVFNGAAAWLRARARIRRSCRRARARLGALAAAYGRLASGRRRPRSAHGARQPGARLAEHDEPVPAPGRGQAAPRDGARPPDELGRRGPGRAPSSGARALIASQPGLPSEHSNRGHARACLAACFIASGHRASGRCPLRAHRGRRFACSRGRACVAVAAALRGLSGIHEYPKLNHESRPTLLMAGYSAGQRVVDDTLAP